MLDGEGNGLEVCDLKGRAVSMEFAVALPGSAEVLVFITWQTPCPLVAGPCA